MALPSFEKLPSRFAFLKGIEWIPPLFHYGWPIEHKDIHLYAKKRGLVIKAWKAPPEDEDDPYRPSAESVASHTTAQAASCGTKITRRAIA